MAGQSKKKPVGKVIHYYDKIGVGIIEFSAALKVGDNVHFKGKHVDFSQSVGSMQVEHEQVEKAKKGDVVGMKVDQKVQDGDLAYLEK